MRAEYEREGWLLVRALIDAPTLASLDAAARALAESARDLVADTRVGPVFFEVQSESGRKREDAVHPGALRKITGASKAEPALAKLRTDARVLAALRACGLANPRCVVDQIVFKLPRVGTGFPFHQDANFLHGDARESLDRYGGAQVIIAIDAADADNGGFEVLGRTHTRGITDTRKHYDTSTTNAGVFDESHRALVPLAPGDAIVFHAHLAHGSGPNRSDRARRVVTLWFVGGAPR